MALTIPNDPSATYSDQAEPDSVDFDILVAGFSRSGVFSGCAVTQRGAGANMSVDVAAGTVVVAGATAAVTAVNKVIGAADATNARFDLITVNSSGTVAVTAGTAAANAVFPAIPASSIVLAAVYVPANATSVVTAQIVDKRVLIPLPSRSVSDTHTDTTAISTTAETPLATLAIPTTVAAGDVVHSVVAGDLFNNSGVAVTYTFKVIIGATTVLTSNALSIATGTNRITWRIDMDVLVAATNDERVSLDMMINSQTAGWNLGTGTRSGAGRGTAAEDLTASKNLQVSVTLSRSDALSDCVCHEAVLEVVKR